MSDPGSTAPARLDTTIIGEAPIDAQRTATLLGRVMSLVALALGAAAVGAAVGRGLGPGAAGFATGRDLAAWLRGLAWAALAIVVVGTVLLLLGIAGSPVLSLAIAVVSAALILVDFFDPRALARRT